MRLLLAFLILCSSAAMAADAPEALETARRLAASGAARLALHHIEQAQPRDPAAPRWAEWEVLRFSLLAQLGRHQDLLTRAGAMPAATPAAPLREAWILAARAAVAVAQGAVARHYAARLLWQLNLSADAAREIRLIVIDSYVADRKGDEAFRGMLRFQQDYHPLERAIATRFVEALLALGMENDAVNWLASLDDASATKLILRLKTGLVTDDGAIAQARAQLVKGRDIGYWRVIAEAAQRQKNPALQIEALERILHLIEPGNPQPITSLARQLWQSYLAAAQEIGNQNQLLTGDDAHWTDFAARRLGASPFHSRAFFAYLARRGQTPETRHNAQLQLVFSLYTGGLDLAALRLFREQGTSVGTLDGQTRHVLGTIAENHNEPTVALHYWQGLDTPPNIGADEWYLRVANVALRADKPDAGMAALKRMLDGRKTLSPDLAQRVMRLAQEMADAGKLDLAQELFELLLPLADSMRARDILFGLGRVNEVNGKSQAAADYFLRSALLAEGKAPDTFALRARLAAGINLARAGYRDDARAQFEWLLRNSKDSAQIEIARRELKKL